MGENIMSCYARGPVCPYECMPCDECPASKPEYAEAFEVTHNSDAMTVAMKNVNTGSFTNKGREASATMQWHETFAIRGSYSYLYTSLDDLVAAPKNQIFAAATWQPFSRLAIDATFKSIDGLYVSPTMNDENYMLLGAKVSYTLLSDVKGVESLQLFTTLDNITDCDYTINEGYKMPGFNAFGGIKLQF